MSELVPFDNFQSNLDYAFANPPAKLGSAEQLQLERYASAPLTKEQEQQVAALAAEKQLSQPATQQAVTPVNPAMVPTQQTVSSVQVDPKLVAKQEQILGSMKDAEQSRVDADIAQNTAVSAELKNRASMLEASAQENAAETAKRAEAGKQKVADLQTAVENFNKNSKINPNRLMENAGVGGRILATIAQAFGAFGAAITHSPNFAQQMIEKAIDADIKAQEHDVATLGQKVNFAQNQYAVFRNQGMDEDAARAATRLLKIQQSMAKVDELIAGTKNAQTQATGAQIKAGLENAANNQLMQYGHSQISTVKQNTSSTGTQLPAIEAERLGTANAAIAQAKKVYEDWDSSARGVKGYVMSLLPMTDASRYDDSRAVAKQIIGSYLEGGVLRKEDEAKYEKFLPKAGESLETGRNKRDKLIAAVAQRAEEQKKALQGAGFNTGTIKINKPVSTFKPLQ